MSIFVHVQVDFWRLQPGARSFSFPKRLAFRSETEAGAEGLHLQIPNDMA